MSNTQAVHVSQETAAQRQVRIAHEKRARKFGQLLTAFIEMDGAQRRQLAKSCAVHGAAVAAGGFTLVGALSVAFAAYNIVAPTQYQDQAHFHALAMKALTYITLPSGILAGAFTLAALKKASTPRPHELIAQHNKQFAVQYKIEERPSDGLTLFERMQQNRPK